MMRNLLLDAQAEILRLRRENEILCAKVDMIELFANVLNTEPARRVQGAAPDVAWALQKEINEIDAAQKAEEQA